MNQEDIAKQIVKFKARKLKFRLAKYAFLTSIFLTISIFAAGFNYQAFLSFLVVAPIPLYFGLEVRKMSRKAQIIRARLAELEANIYELSSRFSPLKFLTQKDLGFRISLIFFVLICLITIARTHNPPMKNPTVTYSLESGF